MKGLLAGLGLGALAVLLVAGFQPDYIANIADLLGNNKRPPQSPVRVVGGSMIFRAIQWTPVVGQLQTFTASADISQIHVKGLVPDGPGQPTSFPPLLSAALSSWEIDIYGHSPDPAQRESGNGISMIALNGVITLRPLQNGGFYAGPAIPIDTANGKFNGVRYHDLDPSCAVSNDVEDICNHIGKIVVIIPNKAPYIYWCPGGECSFGIGKTKPYAPKP